MSVATVRRLGLNGTKRHDIRTPDYVRPAQWLSLPTVVAGDQRFVGLHAVYDHDFNYVALLCQGAYTVDWGDGSAVQNFATGALATHLYTFSAISAATETTDGYRQVIVTVTPQAGQNLTVLDLNRKPTAPVLASGYTTGWLDIRMAAANLTSLVITAVAANVTHRQLERFEYVGPSAIATLVFCFLNCGKLRAVLGTAWTATVTSLANTFQGCAELRTIPQLDTGNCATFSNTFNGCSSLESIPLLNMSKATTAVGMFQACRSLRSIPLLDTSKVTTFATTFNACSALTKLPPLNTSAATVMSDTFNGCSKLQEIPLLDTSKVTTLANAFANCLVLKKVPLLDTTLVQNFSQMFTNCPVLETVPLLNTAAGTNFTQMFDGCAALNSVPLLNVAACASAANFNLIFRNCFSLSKGALAGAKFAISYASCRLAADELNRIYTNLGTASGAQTITVTPNPGTATDDPTIATAKGWTVA